MINQDIEEIKTPEFVSLQFRLAGLGSRGAAMILDLILTGIVNLILVLLLILLDQSSISFLEDSPWTAAIFILIVFAVNWGYFFAGEYFFAGKTIGKKIVGIRVISDNGHSITLLSSFIRNLLRIVDMLPFAYFIGMLMVFFHPRHKRLGDLAAGTIVVHERKTKVKKKTTTIEKEIERLGVSKDDLHLEEWALRSLQMKDWNLIKTYSSRLLQLPEAERGQLTRQVAVILLPKIGIDIAAKNDRELEQALLMLYLKLKDEFEYEL